MNTIILDGSLVSLSESNDETSLEAKFLICPLDVGNANGVGLKENDLTEDEKNGLQNQPVVCKVIKNSNGDYDFTGHNFKVVYEKNKAGQLVKKYEFDTNPIGFHISTEIEEIEIDNTKRNCIVATAKIWKRYDKAISALSRILEAKKNIKTSWEISYAESYEEDGVKWLKDIIWLGNCVLGEFISPAYKDAGLLEIAEEDEELQIAVAFTEDLYNEQQSELSNIDDKSIDDIKITQGGKEMSKEQEKELSALTDNDVYSKVRKAINSTDNNKWYYIARLYPYEFRAIAYEWDRESEDDYVQFSYSVSNEETINIISQKDVKMTFVPKEEIETQIAELQNQLSEKENELSSKIEAITKLGEDISSKESEIAELLPYKEKYEAIEQAEKEAELAQKKEDLKTLATKGGYLTKEDLETPEIAEMIDNLNEQGIKCLIAEKVIAKLEVSEIEKKDQEATEKEVEVSEVSKEKVVKTNINSSSKDTIVSPLSIMDKFLKK